MNLEEKAKRFATIAHAGQTRKYTGEPYINHPANVAALLKTVPHTESMVAAAWLHDVIEDTNVSLHTIANEFGLLVATMVANLTNVSGPSDGNRKARKAVDLEHVAKAYPSTKTIKLADLIDNTRTVVQHDPSFAKIYLKEKESLLGVLTDGDPSLYRLAKQSLDTGFSELRLAA